MIWVASQICFGLLTIVLPFFMLLFWGLRRNALFSSFLVAGLSFASVCFTIQLIYNGTHSIILNSLCAFISIVGGIVVYKIYRSVSKDVAVNKGEFMTTA
ncbi:hypothetical protein ACJ2A9_09810 [Anaerobacillus sp. MEB173]|uniref:hypothetical protein n=1 Tax=Anaerobacillus sp. MEB173 TaxID=3383345 RepID=UPI003F920ADA